MQQFLIIVLQLWLLFIIFDLQRDFLVIFILFNPNCDFMFVNCDHFS